MSQPRYFYVRVLKPRDDTQVHPWVAVEANGKCNHLAAVAVLTKSIPAHELSLVKERRDVFMVEVLYSLRVPAPRQLPSSVPVYRDAWYRSVNDFLMGPGLRWFWTHVSDDAAPDELVAEARAATAEGRAEG